MVPREVLIRPPSRSEGALSIKSDLALRDADFGFSIVRNSSFHLPMDGKCRGRVGEIFGWLHSAHSAVRSVPWPTPCRGRTGAARAVPRGAALFKRCGQMSAVGRGRLTQF